VHPEARRRLYLAETGFLPRRCTRRTQRNPGRYTVQIRDCSPIHDFHLLGPGVNKKTSVQNTGGATWTVRLRQGRYRYRCDPHRAIMHGRFSVS
jgi:plastocyanin